MKLAVVGVCSAAIAIGCTSNQWDGNQWQGNQRPDAVQSASWFLRPDTGDTNVPRYSSSETVESVLSTSGDVRVHFTRAGANAVPALDADQNGRPDFVDEVARTYDEVRAKYHGEMGFREPLSDGATPDGNGGDAAFDVYLVDFAGRADGQYRREICLEDGKRCSGYMLQENDFTDYGYPSISQAIRILSSHEYFHAVQAAYDNEQGAVISEGTAVWATEQFDSSLGDFESLTRGYFERTGTSLGQTVSGPVDVFSYGTAIFFQYLTERQSPLFVRKLWEYVAADGAHAGTTWYEALPALLGDATIASQPMSFAEAFRDFANWNLFTGSRAQGGRKYANAAGYPEVTATQAGDSYSDSRDRYFPASAHYFRLSNPPRDLRVEWIGANGAVLDLSAAVAVSTPGSTGTVTPDRNESSGLSLTLPSTTTSVLIAIIDSRATGSSHVASICIGSEAYVAECRAQTMTGDAALDASNRDAGDRDASVGAPPASSSCSLTARGSNGSSSFWVFFVLFGLLLSPKNRLRSNATGAQIALLAVAIFVSGCSTSGASLPAFDGGADAHASDAHVADTQPADAFADSALNDASFNDARPGDAGTVGESFGCNDSFGGQPLSEGISEENGSFENELMNVDLSQLGPSIPVGELAGILRYTVLYALHMDPSTTALSTADLLGRTGPLARVVLAAFAKKQADGQDGIDFRFLRQGLHRYYACDTGLPRTLADFVLRFGDYTEWASSTISQSRPKAGPRKLYQNSNGEVFVAETWLGNGEIREIEILMQDNTRDGQLNFAVYTLAGELSNTSEFATNGGGTVVSSSPYTCMSCHIDLETGRYDVLRPD